MRICPECKMPMFADYPRKLDICPMCYIPNEYETPFQISWSQMQAYILFFQAITGTQKATAEALGISPQYLNDILRGRREISDAVAEKFGLERVVVYMQRRHP